MEGLKWRRKVELHVKCFRSKEVTIEDVTTGKPYTLPVIPADLPTQAFIDAGFDEVTAQRYAETLQADLLPFDQSTEHRRRVAVQRARAEYEAFCFALDKPQSVSPSETVQITNERGFKVALTLCMASSRH